MTQARCGICEAADYDLGTLIASQSVIPSRLTDQIVRDTYAQLRPWVGHVHVLPDPRAHVAPLRLPTLSGTAYLQNVLGALGNPDLQDASLFTMGRSVQYDVIASALVLLVSDAHVWPPGPYRDLVVRIARSWGWSGGTNTF